jgi:hypothetical protein
VPRKATNQPRYIVQDVSVGANGLTSRPAVFDTKEGSTVKTFRSNGREAAGRLAAQLNSEATATKAAPATAQAAWDKVNQIMGGQATKAAKATKAAPAKATDSPERSGARVLTAEVAASLRPAAAHTSKDAARIGEPAGTGTVNSEAGRKLALAAYIVRWPHASYDALQRLADVNGGGPAWLARCNAHGAVHAADTMQACLKLGRREALAEWCPGHKAEATKAAPAAKATKATKAAK